MPLFKKRIEISTGVHRTFEFRRIFSVNGVRYYVMGLDISGRPHMLHMDYVGDTWKIGNAKELPDDFSKIEKQLSDAIGEHLSEPDNSE